MAAQDRFITRRYFGNGFKNRLILFIFLVALIPVGWDLLRITKNNVPPKISTPNDTKVNASTSSSKLSRQTSILSKLKLYPIVIHPSYNKVISVKTEKLYNPGGFQYPNSELCRPFKRSKIQPLKLLILITSAPFLKNCDRRDGIRESWGQQIQKNRSDVRLAFVLGRLREENNRSSEQIRIKEEMKLYNDLIIGNFVDSFDNLTLKTMSLLEWTSTFCNEAKYLLKADDDMWINTPNILKMIERIDKQNEELQISRGIYGYSPNIWTGPYRDPKTKYFVSEKQYPNSSFPAYLFGSAYLIPGGKLVEDLFKEGLKTDFLWLEDVFLTGVVANGLGLKRVHLKKFYVQRHEFGWISNNTERSKRTKCEIAKWAVVHLLRIGKRRVSVKEEQANLWRVLEGYEGKNVENCSVYID